jgi:hypothetical protein
MLRRVPTGGLLMLITLVLIVTSGCSSGKRYKVSGKVLVNSKPAAGAVVVLSPIDNPTTMDRKPIGIAREDGTFNFNTLTDDDGVAAGDYLVSIIWPGKPTSSGAPKGLGGGDDERATASDQLRGKFSDPQRSGIKVTIESKAYELPPFELAN